jgi:CspA family cold shock protein
MTGEIKWFREDKGYGFIKGDNGQEYFVHYSAFPDGHTRGLPPEATEPGRRVSFDVMDDNGRGLKAVGVQLIWE